MEFLHKLAQVFVLLPFPILLSIAFQTYLGSDYSAYSPTSPGSISSTFRHNSRTQENGCSSRSVFNVLYKPDLIKLSSPLILRKNYQENNVITGGKQSLITPTREEMTTRWVKETSNNK